MSINEDFWRNVYKKYKWIIYDVPKPDKIYVYNFDNGNEKYRKYFNEWNIYGESSGKVALINTYENNIKIPSISHHKIRYYQN